MARSRFTYDCGHSGEVSGRNRRDADNYAARKSQEKCRECITAERATEAAATTEALALPALTGTPKQINWANQLRLAALEQMTLTVAEVNREAAEHYSEAAQGEIRDALALLETELLGATEARFWIAGHYETFALGSAAWAVHQIRKRHLCPGIERPRPGPRKAS